MSDVSTVYVAWRDPKDRGWYPIGRLDAEAGLFSFRYIQGAQGARQYGFAPLMSFPELDQVYTSEELFPVFQNRLLPTTRADYEDHLNRLALSLDQAEPLVVLARNGGRRVTDTLELFARPVRDPDGTFHTDFFAHGLRHLLPEPEEAVKSLRPNDRLRLCHDIQNPTDGNALLLRTEGGAAVGWIPRYMNTDLLMILNHDPDALVVTVVKVNAHPAPPRQRLFCRAVAPWPEGFEPYSTDDYKPLGHDE